MTADMHLPEVASPEDDLDAFCQARLRAGVARLGSVALLVIRENRAPNAPLWRAQKAVKR
jgi:hypothetical protein